MATLYSKSAKIFDVNQLISLQKPLEIFVTERNQEDNAAVLDYVNEFLDVIDAELKQPRKQKEYVFGQKEAYVRVKLAQRLEIVASRILEKEAMKCSTLSLSELEFFEEELNLFADLYFVLVTTLIDLSALRKNDLVKGDPYDELFDIVGENLNSLKEISQMTTLFSELDRRKNSYDERPALRKRIDGLLRKLPKKSGDFLFAPAQSITNYSSGDVLVSIHPESDVAGIEIGELPDGVDLNEETGELFVKNPNDLKPGDYSVILKTSDELGGVSKMQLKLPIGAFDIPRYVVAPSKVAQDYYFDDILAKPTFSEYAKEIAKAEWMPSSKDKVPQGIMLDDQTGFVQVQDPDLLAIGNYRVVVILTDIDGGKSRHDFTLTFRQDNDAVYTVKPNKLITEFKEGDILATVSDVDGKIIGAQRNQLPSGMIINSAGQIIVENPSKLKSGTHVFNVLAKDAKSIRSMKTLFLSLDPAKNGFVYDRSGLKPIDDLENNDKIAFLTNSDGLVAAKATVVGGDLPEGTTLMPNGDLIVTNVAKLEVGSYDIRVKVFVDGINSKNLSAAEDQLVVTKDTLESNQTERSNSVVQIEAKKFELSEYQSSYTQEQIKLNNGIQSLQTAIKTAKGPLLDQLLGQQSAKQKVLSRLTSTANAQIKTLTSGINKLQDLVDSFDSENPLLESEIKALSNELVTLRQNRWNTFEVPLALNFEKDNDSAWHLEIPKEYDEYMNNDIVAKLIDCDGYSEVSIIDGSLPLGLVIDKSLGAVIVDDHTSLVPGEYVVKTRSVDKEKGETEHRLVVLIDGTLTNQDEKYILLPAKAANNYVEGEIIGYPYSASYAIISARIAKGLLPNGVVLDENTGALIVDDPSLLRHGYYNGIVVKTWNDTSSLAYHDITITFGAQTIFNVKVTPPYEISKYAKGDKIIEVQVSGGSLQGIQIVGGTFAPGLMLNSTAGLVQVVQPTSLVAGNYQMDLKMASVNGASDTQKVDYAIGRSTTDPGNGGGKAIVVWSNNTPIPQDVAKTQTTLATPTISNDQIVSAFSTNIPPGIELNQSTGELFVSSQDRLIVGAYKVFINLQAKIGGSFNEEVPIEILHGSKTVPTDTTTPTEPTVPTIVAKVTPPADFHIIKNGYVLSRLSPEDSVLTATLTSGSIPKGSVLDAATGRITVKDRKSLVRTLTNGQLTVHVGSGSTSAVKTPTASSSPTTSAATPGTAIGASVSFGGSITSRASATSGASQLVDVAIVNHPIPDFTKKIPTAAFITGMVARLETFKRVHLSSSKASTVVKTHFTEIESFAKTTFDLIKSTKGKDALLKGDHDSSYGKRYEVLANPLIKDLKAQSSKVAIEALVDLYNELFTTYLAMTIYRNQDISSLTTCPIAVMCGKMDAHLETISGKTNVLFLRENASVIYAGIPTTYKNLRVRIGALRS